MRKLTGLILTAALVLSMLTVFGFSVGAEEGTIEVNAGIADAAASADKTKGVAPSAINAFYVHNVIVNVDRDVNYLTPVDGQATSDYNLDPNGPKEAATSQGQMKEIRTGAMPENITDSNALYNPYVCYKLSADSGNQIDGLSLHIKGYLRDSNNCYYQIGVWVTDSFEHDENGAYDFTASDYALLISSEPGKAWNSISGDGETEFDLSSAAGALGSKDVYVIFLLNRGYGKDDATRVRIKELTLTATQKPKQAGSGSGNSGASTVTQGESITINANIPSASNANGIGAYYVHNCVVTSISGNMALAPADGQVTAQYNLDPSGPSEYDGKAIKTGAKPEHIAEDNALYNPYVAYKISGDKGNVIDTLTLDIRYYLRQHNWCYYQIGIWVTDRFEHDENGAFDFTALPYAKLLTSDETNPSDHRRAEDTEHIDLTTAVRKLKSRDVYVIFLLIRGADNSAAGGRMRIQDITLKADQKISSAATGDPAVSAAIAGASFCALGLAVITKIRRKEN